MTPIIKHYVTFFFKIGAETKEIKLRNIEDLDVPQNCERFMFFDRTEAVTDDGEILYGAEKNNSCMYYLGESLTYKEVKSICLREPWHKNYMTEWPWPDTQRFVRRRSDGRFEAVIREDSIVLQL